MHETGRQRAPIYGQTYPNSARETAQQHGVLNIPQRAAADRLPPTRTHDDAALEHLREPRLHPERPGEQAVLLSGVAIHWPVAVPARSSSVHGPVSRTTPCVSNAMVLPGAPAARLLMPDASTIAPTQDRIAGQSLMRVSGDGQITQSPQYRATKGKSPALRSSRLSLSSGRADGPPAPHPTTNHSPTSSCCITTSGTLSLVERTLFWCC
jgi:hypothetical protein